MSKDDEQIVKVRRTGTSNAITIPKKRAFESFRKVPYVKISRKSEQGRQFLIVELLEKEVKS